MDTFLFVEGLMRVIKVLQDNSFFNKTEPRDRLQSI